MRAWDGQERETIKLSKGYVMLCLASGVDPGTENCEYTRCDSCSDGRIKMSSISPSDLCDMHEPAGYPWRLLHRSILRNVPRYLFSCVFNPEVLRFLLLLLLAAKAEVSPVGSQARIE